MTLMPSSRDTSREALKIPVATAAFSRGMASSTLEVNGTVSPPPIPITAKMGIREPASGPGRLTEATPAAISSMATPTTLRGGSMLSRRRVWERLRGGLGQ
jgi:hypothetical protein